MSNPFHNDETPLPSSHSCVEDELLEDCFLCKQSLKHLRFEERTLHVNQCLDQQAAATSYTVVQHHNSKTIMDHHKQMYCYVCGKDLTRFTLKRRQTHVNKCLDKQQQQSTTIMNNDNYCIFCKKRDLQHMTLRSRIKHLKQCAKIHNYSIDQVKQMVEQQQVEKNKPIRVDDDAAHGASAASNNGCSASSDMFEMYRFQKNCSSSSILMNKRRIQPTIQSSSSIQPTIQPPSIQPAIQPSSSSSIQPSMKDNGRSESVVIQWLKSIHMDTYISQFMDSGYDQMNVCMQLDDNELEHVIKITRPGHRKQILLSIQQQSNQQSNQQLHYDVAAPLSQEEQQSSSQQEENMIKNYVSQLMYTPPRGHLKCTQDMNPSKFQQHNHNSLWKMSSLMEEGFEDKKNELKNQNECNHNDDNNDDDDHISQEFHEENEQVVVVSLTPPLQSPSPLQSPLQPLQSPLQPFDHVQQEEQLSPVQNKKQSELVVQSFQHEISLVYKRLQKEHKNIPSFQELVTQVLENLENKKPITNHAQVDDDHHSDIVQIYNQQEEESMNIHALREESSYLHTQEPTRRLLVDKSDDNDGDQEEEPHWQTMTMEELKDRMSKFGCKPGSRSFMIHMLKQLYRQK